MKTLSIILIGMCIGGSVVKLVNTPGDIIFPTSGETAVSYASFCKGDDPKLDNTGAFAPLGDCLFANTPNDLVRLAKDLIKSQEENTTITIPVATSSDVSWYCGLNRDCIEISAATSSNFIK